MLSWILLILIVAIVCLLGTMLSMQLFGRGEALPPVAETMDVIEHNRHAVHRGDTDAITLEVVHRGYRMDQVDDLIAQLADLRARVDATENGRALAREGVELGERTAFEGEVSHGSNETPHR